MDQSTVIVIPVSSTRWFGLAEGTTRKLTLQTFAIGQNVLCLHLIASIAVPCVLPPLSLASNVHDLDKTCPGSKGSALLSGAFVAAPFIYRMVYF